MRLDEYQALAQETDQYSTSSDNWILIPLLGLVGEAGALVSEYKKLLRDGDAHVMFRDQVKEELGDLLWYIANLATKYHLSLSLIAQNNLAKAKDRFIPPKDPPELFDVDFPEAEQLPRSFELTLAERTLDGQQRVVLLDSSGEPVGNSLTDNAYDDDGYRYHDVFHLAYAAILGWSPVTRKILGKKRKSNQTVDEIEDGGRARVIEEAIAAAAYEYASRHHFLEGANRIDWELLRSIKRLTANWEVAARGTAEWEKAILTGFEVWRKVRTSNGGCIRGDLQKRSFTYVTK